MRINIIILALSLAATASFSQNNNDTWAKVENVLNRKLNVSNNTAKVTYPRTDLNVKIDGQKVEPGLALTSWVAFMDMGGSSMMMGDLVLLESEIPAVERKLVSNNISITGIHNHIMGETPVIKYIHYSATGNPETLASGIKDVLSATSTPLTESKEDPLPTNTADWSAVENVLGMKGQEKGDLLQYAIKRNDAIVENGMTIPPSMGMAISINFQKTQSGALSTGDFVLTSDEINPVIKELTESGINVTALHNHMLSETPRLFFLHFWGDDDPVKLASGLKNALDHVNYAKQ